MDVPKSVQQGFDIDESKPTEVAIGHLIISETYELYKNVFNHHNSFVQEVIEKADRFMERCGIPRERLVEVLELG